jgi:hypothetical protein
VDILNRIPAARVEAPPSVDNVVTGDVFSSSIFDCLSYIVEMSGGSRDRSRSPNIILMFCLGNINYPNNISSGWSLIK